MIVVIAITAAGAIAQGSIGIGIGLIAGPALVAIDPAFVPGPLLLVAQIVGLRHIIVEREHADMTAWRNGMIGLPFGLAAASLPGPPLVCVYADMEPPKMRSTTSMLIIWVAVIGVGGLLLSGNFGSHEFELMLWLLPGTLVGLIMARWVRPFIDRAWFRKLILVVALCGGTALVARQLV